LLERTDDDRARSPDDAMLAQELAGELGGLALGLEQAGAYISTERFGFARYLKLWREKRATVLDWFDKTLMSYDHDTGLAATWATSVDRLTPDARRLLERLAFLAPEPIPDSLLDVAAPGDPDGFDARAARVHLFAYSLVSRAAVVAGKAAQDGFVVHRLVQDFARRSMTEEQRGEALREALEWVDAAFDDDPQDVRSWPVLDPLVPHALAVARRTDQEAIVEPTGRLFNQLAMLLQTKARYAESELLYRRALAIGEGSLESDHPSLARCLNNLAVLLCAANRFGEAEPLFRRALAIAETNYGPAHPDVAACLSNYGELLRITNRLSEAEPLFRRALAIDEASHGSNHPHVAIRLNNLALLLQAMNRLGEVEPLFRRALAINEAKYGPDHPAVAINFNNLAGSLRATSRLGEAEPLYRRALAIDEASYGPDHPQVATDLNNLAGLLRVVNRLGEAEPLFRRALAIDDQNRGPDHPAVARDLNNLALVLVNTKRLDDAEPLYRRALAIAEASYGSDHPWTALVRDNLAALEAERG
jgi:tetratricopeptide (TPR) repeat protein